MTIIPPGTESCLLMAAEAAIEENIPEVLDHILNTPGFPLDSIELERLMDANPNPACLQVIQAREWRRQ